jgi:hypothetical protein
MTSEMSESFDEEFNTQQLDQIIYILLTTLLGIAALFYIIRKVFKCYLSCRTDSSGARRTSFKAGFRGDSPGSTASETTPIRHDCTEDEQPATPPHYEEV